MDAALTHEDHPLVTAEQRPQITLGVAVGLASAAFVCFLTIVSWSMALVDAHNGVAAVAASTLLTVAIIRLAGRHRPAVRVERAEVLGAVVVAVVAAYFVLPAFAYAYVDKDPGVYAAHGFSIARDGGFTIDDPLLAAGRAPELRPGLWVEPDDPEAVTPQFYHAFPALLATAHDVGGRTLLFTTTPLLAILAVSSFYVAVRSVFGDIAGVLAGLLIGSSMIQVWQARTPGSEILVQALLAGALLAVVCMLRTRWALPAGLAGVLITATFLVRPDGFVYVALAGAGLGLALLFEGWRNHWRWFALGLVSITPAVWWNAYDLRISYSRSNGVPDAVVVAAALVVPALTATAMAGPLRRVGLFRISQRRVQIAGAVVAALTIVALVLFWYRPEILGEHFPTHPVTGEAFRSYDEQALRWLSFFIPVVGLAAMCFGWAVVLTRRPIRAEQLALVAPGLLLLPLYLWDARIASRMMWWTRRFVPIVLPTMLVLVAVGLAWLLARRSRSIRVGGAGLAVYLLWFGGTQSYDLREHREVEGSWEMGTDIAGTAPTEDTVFVIDGDRSDIVAPNRNLPGALWLIHDHPAYRMPPDGGFGYVAELADLLDRPVLLVLESDELPTGYPDDQFDKVAQMTEHISLFEETPAHRPDKTNRFSYELGVWRFVG